MHAAAVLEMQMVKKDVFRKGNYPTRGAASVPIVVLLLGYRRERQLPNYHTTNLVLFPRQANTKAESENSLISRLLAQPPWIP